MEMTTPVFTRKGEPSGKRMDMTTPVITKKVGAVWLSHEPFFWLSLFSDSGYCFLYQLESTKKFYLPLQLVCCHLQSVDKNQWKMSFVMPSKYGSDLPLPKDPSVTTKEVPSKIVAVAAFSGPFLLFCFIYIPILNLKVVFNCCCLIEHLFKF